MTAEAGAEQPPSARVATSVGHVRQPAPEPQPEREQTLAQQQAILASRHSSHAGGIPVGALLVPKQQANGVRKLLKPFKLRLVAVSWAAAGNLLLHLPPEAAAALDQLDQVPAAGCGKTSSPDQEEGGLGEALQQFVQQSGAVYYPGVRALDPLLPFDRKGWPRLALKPEPLAPPALPSNGFRFAEVFAGIGGFRAGLQPLGGTLEHTLTAGPRRHTCLAILSCAMLVASSAELSTP